MNTPLLKLGPTADGAGYLKLRDALAMAESSNNPGAIQRHTRAVGLYQFIPRYWETFFWRETNRTLLSFLPKDPSAAERARAEREQKEILFPLYYTKQIAPFVAKTRADKVASSMSDIQVATAFHKLGAGAATKYFTTGFDASAGTADNEAIAAYIAKVDHFVSGAAGGQESMLASEHLNERAQALRDKYA